MRKGRGATRAESVSTLELALDVQSRVGAFDGLARRTTSPLLPHDSVYLFIAPILGVRESSLWAFDKPAAGSLIVRGDRPAAALRGPLEPYY